MTEPIVTGFAPSSPVKPNMAYKVFRQGWLLKNPPRAVRKKLHRYWFVLFQQKDMLAFLYFQDEDHYLERKKNEGFFRIDECTSIDVVTEHLGRKNAFCITTPKTKYFLVSESRYELHHWLIALHEARDEYKMAQVNGKKKCTKQRSQSVVSPPSSLPRTNKKKKPMRPAPPAPPAPLAPLKAKKKGDEENVPPSDSVSQATTDLSDSMQDLPSPTTNQLDDIVAGLLQQSQQPSTLDFTLTEDDDVPLVNGNNPNETGLLSMSLPALNDCVDEELVAHTEESNSDEDDVPQHTRHFSFSDSYEFQSNNGEKKKSNRKRAGSMKGRRSVSPPNLPPPPPPPTDESTLDYNGEQVINSFEQDYIEKVTIVNKSSPKPPPPQRTTSLHGKQQNRDSEVSEVSDYLEEAFLQEDDQLELVSQSNGKSPGILRKGEQSKSTKRTVAFEESVVKGRYEPRVDHESTSTNIAKAKAKLFGETESESFRYTRTQLQNYSNVEPQDELLEAIESALQPTSYMEQGEQSKGGFSINIGPPDVPPPVRTAHDGSGYTVETSPTETTNLATDWSNPTIDDVPTTSTFTPDHDTMYRSIV